jgi:hypothetical protein
MLKAEFPEEDATIFQAAPAEAAPAHERRKTTDELGRASLTADPELVANYTKLYDAHSGDLDALAAKLGDVSLAAVWKKDPPADGQDWATCMVLGAYE